MTAKSPRSFSLAIHGGAGGNPQKAAKTEDIVREAMHDILEHGRELLAHGGSALDAVTLCVKLLEDCPLFNAGCGAVPNLDGIYELDASIMDGKNLAAGAVGGVVNVRNPVDLARVVMEETPHVLLIGKSAVEFGRGHGIQMVTQRYFRDATKKARKLVEKNRKHGTVGAVARDSRGNLAAATSTGGREKKMPGRVGDTPIIGAGNFADNRSVAVSCTGIGEHFIKTVLSGHMGFLVAREGMDAKRAARAGIKYLVERVNGDGGFILIDKKGGVAVAQSSTVMRAGWIEHGGKTRTTLQAPIRVKRRK